MDLEAQLLTDTKHRQDWEELAQVDPCWAILSDPNRKFGAWDVEEFFRTGEIEFAEGELSGKSMTNTGNVATLIVDLCPKNDDGEPEENPIAKWKITLERVD